MCICASRCLKKPALWARTYHKYNCDACDGDALAIALLTARGFTANDFALSHPGGALGRKLLLLVRDLMNTGDDIPIFLKARLYVRHSWRLPAKTGDDGHL